MFLFNGSLTKYSDGGFAVARLAIGIVMMFHGILKFTGDTTAHLVGVGKAMGAFGVPSEYFFFLGLLAAVVEVVSGLLTGIGLFTRINALLLIGTMIVAVVMTFKGGFNVWSHAFTLMLYYIGLLIGGPGKCSLDYKYWGKKEEA